MIWVILPRASAGILRYAVVHAPGSDHFASTADYERDFRVLHARPGCGLDELKRAHRVAVRSLHPDANPELANDATAQHALTEMNAAWRRLSEYHRVHGRLPFAPDATTTDAFLGENVVDVARPSFGGRAGLVVLVLVVAGAWAAWPAGDADPQPLEPFDPGVASAAAERAPANAPASVAPGRSAAVVRLVKLGDSKARTREILGPPILKLDGNWEYGPSYVEFRDGRVVGWYSSPLNPLAVDESSREAIGTSGMTGQ